MRRPDIDECVESVLKQCAGDDDVCVNTRGGHFCQTIACPVGFVKAPRAASHTAERLRLVRTCPCRLTTYTSRCFCETRATISVRVTMTVTVISAWLTSNWTGQATLNTAAYNRKRCHEIVTNLIKMQVKISFSLSALEIKLQSHSWILSHNEGNTIKMARRSSTESYTPS